MKTWTSCGRAARRASAGGSDVVPGWRLVHWAGCPLGRRPVSGRVLVFLPFDDEEDEDDDEEEGIPW